MNWDGAACTPQDGSLFFGPAGEPASRRNWREGRARAICERCPLRLPCLDYALTRRITHGVWGGMTEAGRANLLRRRQWKASRDRRAAAMSGGAHGS